ncbi:disulfide bond formation protein B [Streptomyces sp. NPDC003077]|uniref:disulfide bond formation protein B n=1 Tax=Streptomyces sp. NPDC003077 TaxID=3154443 RepID=UPI0033A6B13B
MSTRTLIGLEPGPPALVARGQYWFACVVVIGWTGVLGGGLYYQFGRWEYPCPLCVVQRMFMVLASLGAAYIVRQGLDGVITRRDYLMGWGLSLVACVAGSFAAWRQTMLHILPGDRGYGSTALGLHLYVWAWILFQACVVAIGVVMAFGHLTAARRIPMSGLYQLVGRFALGVLTLVIAVNVVAVFLEEGFHWFLPDDPDRYRFFYDVWILP